MLDMTILAKVSGIRVSGRSVSTKKPFICVKTDGPVGRLDTSMSVEGKTPPAVANPNPVSLKQSCISGCRDR